MSAWVSITGIYNYRPDIFDGLMLPQVSDINNDKIEYIENIQPLDKDLLIKTILMDLAELGLVYADPDQLKLMIDIWSSLERPNWLALWETILYKYNPIWNKDGEIREERGLERGGTSQTERSGLSGNTRTESREESGTASGSFTEADTGTIRDAGTSSSSGQGSGNKTIAHNVTGFDTNSYSPNTQDVENGSTSHNDSGTNNNTRTLDTQRTGSNTGTDSRSGSGTITDSGSSSGTESATTSGTEAETIRRVEQGNIGVTMTQDMIKQQREIVQFNLYRYITDSFKRQFCLMVY